MQHVRHVGSKPLGKGRHAIERDKNTADVEAGCL
jgi:hypothetical protein